MASELGLGKCINCKAQVLYKVDKAGKVYFVCSGNEDRQACGFSGKFGSADSRKLVAHFEKGKSEDEDRSGRHDDRDGERDAGEPEREPERESEKRRGGILDGIFE